MHVEPREPRLRPILIQATTVAAFFLPAWLIYGLVVAPGLRPEQRVVWDIAGPAAAFVVIAAATFGVRAWRMAHKRAVADGRA